MSENEKDHERIWLEPMVLDGGYGPEGRCWSHDNPWPEDQGDMPATEYVRADLLTAAEARIKMLSEALEPFGKALDGADDDKAGDAAHIWEAPAAMNITYGDLRRARKETTHGN